MAVGHCLDQFHRFTRCTNVFSARVTPTPNMLSTCLQAQRLECRAGACLAGALSGGGTSYNTRQATLFHCHRCLILQQMRRCSWHYELSRLPAFIGNAHPCFAATFAMVNPDQALFYMANPENNRKASTTAPRLRPGFMGLLCALCVLVEPNGGCYCQ